jgi:hypothetical protein
MRKYNRLHATEHTEGRMMYGWHGAISPPLAPGGLIFVDTADKAHVDFLAVLTGQLGSKSLMLDNAL